MKSSLITSNSHLLLLLLATLQPTISTPHNEIAAKLDARSTLITHDSPLLINRAGGGSSSGGRSGSSGSRNGSGGGGRGSKGKPKPKDEDDQEKDPPEGGEPGGVRGGENDDNRTKDDTDKPKEGPEKGKGDNSPLSSSASKSVTRTQEEEEPEQTVSERPRSGVGLSAGTIAPTTATQAGFGAATSTGGFTAQTSSSSSNDAGRVELRGVGMGKLVVGVVGGMLYML